MNVGRIACLLWKPFYSASLARACGVFVFVRFGGVAANLRYVLNPEIV